MLIFALANQALPRLGSAPLKLLEKQRNLLKKKLEGVEAESRVGVRTAQEIINAEREFACSNELIKLVEFRSELRDAFWGSLHKLIFLPVYEQAIRVEVANEAVQRLSKSLLATRARHNVGEVTLTDVTTMEAALVEAQIYRDSFSQSYFFALPPICGKPLIKF